MQYTRGKIQNDRLLDVRSIGYSSFALVPACLLGFTGRPARAKTRVALSDPIMAPPARRLAPGVDARPGARDVDPRRVDRRGRT